MKLLEYQGKIVLADAGIPVPVGEVAAKSSEAAGITGRILANGPGKVAVKAQVPVGGRGKAGGIKLAETPAAAEAAAGQIIGMDIKGCQVDLVLVETAINIEKEMYMSFILDGASGKYLFLFSPEGGMDIEELAEKHPEKILRAEFVPATLLGEHVLRDWLRKFGMRGETLKNLSQIAWKLYLAVTAKDLILAEINPLVITADGQIMAADAKVEIDDNALYRHAKERAWLQQPKNELERRAKEIGVTYVQLDGDIAIVASGAGLAMNTMDIIQEKNHKPANFLETGGGITAKLIEDAIGLVCAPAGIRGLIVNLYGGVNPLVAAAEGVVAGVNNMKTKIPVVVKAMGNQQEDCWAIIEKEGIPVIKTHETEEAVNWLVGKIGGVQA